MRQSKLIICTPRYQWSEVHFQSLQHKPVRIVQWYYSWYATSAIFAMCDLLRDFQMRQATITTMRMPPNTCWPCDVRSVWRLLRTYKDDGISRSVQFRFVALSFSIVGSTTKPIVAEQQYHLDDPSVQVSQRLRLLLFKIIRRELTYLTAVPPPQIPRSPPDSTWKCTTTLKSTCSNPVRSGSASTTFNTISPTTTKTT